MDATQSVGEPRALVSRDALVHNACLIRQTVGSAVKICAIVKADAYGHSADIVVDTLTSYGHETAEPPLVDAFAVASIDEAIALPPTDLPVYIFRPVENVYIGRQREKLEAALRAGWVLTVCSIAAAEDVARLALAVGRRANVQVMLNTGMTRSGIDCEGFAALYARIRAMPALRLTALCTHFACSEEHDNPLTQQQLARFLETTRCVDGDNAPALIRHTANSGAIFLHPNSHLEMVRPGLALYGIDPTCKPCLDRPLRPVMRWVAPLVMMRNIKAGTAVGYGQTWQADRDTTLGLIPVGYADGYLRAFSSVASVIVNGRPCRVVGRVSMDLITVDLGPNPQAIIGDEVTILDDDPLSPASVYALANHADTIPYELFCRIGRRIPRIAVEPKVVSSNSIATASDAA